jgi:peptidoglycan hydrolase CwlO-like protein
MRWQHKSEEEKVEELHGDVDWLLAHVKDLEKHKEENDTRIKQIMTHGNNMMDKISAIEKMIEQMGR